MKVKDNTNATIGITDIKNAMHVRNNHFVFAELKFSIISNTKSGKLSSEILDSFPLLICLISCGLI